MVLPAFGALTGGMDAGHAAIRKALSPADSIEATCVVRGQLVRLPLWQQPKATPALQIASGHVSAPFALQ